jgi:hypothetical protein
MSSTWLNPSLEIRASSLQGRGAFAIAPIDAGEVVTVWEHRIVTAADLRYGPMRKTTRRISVNVRKVQSGSLHGYVAYIFIALVALLGLLLLPG